MIAQTKPASLGYAGPNQSADRPHRSQWVALGTAGTMAAAFATALAHGSGWFGVAAVAAAVSGITSLVAVVRTLPSPSRPWEAAVAVVALLASVVGLLGLGVVSLIFRCMSVC